MDSRHESSIRLIGLRAAGLLCLAASLAMAAGAGICEETDGGGGPDGKTARPPMLAGILPDGAVFVLTLPDPQVSLERLRETGIWKALSHESFLAAFAPAESQLRTAMLAAQQVLKAHPKDVLDAVRGEITLAVIPLPLTEALPDARADGVGARTDGGGAAGGDGKIGAEPSHPVLVLGIYAGDQAGNLAVFLDGAIGTLVMMTGGTFKYTSQPFAGRTVRILAAPGNSGMPETAFSVAEGFLVAASGPGRSGRKAVEALLGNMKKNDDSGLLRGNAIFRRATERPGGGAPDAVIYADAGRFESVLTPEAAEAMRRLMEAAGAGGLRRIAYSLSIERGIFRETLRLEAKDRKGILAAASENPLEGEPFRDVPDDAAAAAALRFDPRSAYDAVMAVFRAFDIETGQRIEALMTEAEKASNVNFRRDVLEALFSGEVSLAASLDGAAGGSLPIRMLPRLTFRAGIRDQGKALEALVAASRFAAAFGAKPRDLNLSGYRVAVFGSKDPPLAIACALAGDRLVAALYPMAVMEAIRSDARRQNAGPAPGADAKPPAGSDSAPRRSLADLPAFRELASNIEGRPSLMLYFDTAAAATLAYNTAVPILQMGAARLPRVVPIDPHLLPDGETIRRSLGAALMAVSAGADEMAIYGRSRTGALLPLGAAASAAMALLVERELNSCVSRYRQAEESLAKIGGAIERFATDNAGRYPVDIGELAPKYVEEWFAKIGHITYLGRQEKQDRVVAYAAPSLRRGAEGIGGSMPVLLQDGSIRWIRSASLAEVLKRGVAELDLASRPLGRWFAGWGDAPPQPVRSAPPREDNF